MQNLDLKGKLETFRNFTKKKDMTVPELLAVGRMIEDTVTNAVKTEEGSLLGPTYFPKVTIERAHLDREQVGG